MAGVKIGRTLDLDDRNEKFMVRREVGRGQKNWAGGDIGANVGGLGYIDNVETRYLYISKLIESTLS